MIFLLVIWNMKGIIKIMEKEVMIETRIGVYGVIIRDGKIALVKKANGGYKGLYDLPGGGIERGEEPIETLHRELMEEVGVKVISEKILGAVATTIKWDVNDKLVQDLHHIGILYTVLIEGDTLKTSPDGLDSLGGLWMDIESIRKDIVSPFTWMALQELGYKK